MASLPPRPTVMTSSSLSTPKVMSIRAPLSKPALVSSPIASSTGVESRLLARFDEWCKKQHDAILDHHFAMLTEIRACTRTVHAGMNQQSMSTHQQASIQHFELQEKRILDFVQACSQRQEDALAMLSTRLDAIMPQQATGLPAACQQASFNVVPGEIESVTEAPARAKFDEDRDAKSSSLTSAAQKVLNDASQDMCEDALTLELLASVPDDSASSLKTPLLSKRASSMLVSTKETTKASIDGIIQSAEAEEDECVDNAKFWPRLANHIYYHDAIIAIVILNLIWLGIETDINNADVLCHAPWYVQVVDNFFCICFVVDISIRCFARETHSLHFWFDLLLASQMIWETWVQVAIYLRFGSQVFHGGGMMQVLRVFRILRVTRALRMQKALAIAPQLVILVKGIFVAMQSVCAILFLILICIYFFAVVFTMLDKTQDLGGNFKSVPQSMEFFLVQILSGVDGDFMSTMLEVGFAYYVLFLSFVFIGTLTLMNMLIGVVCDVMSTVSSEEKEKLDSIAVQKVVADMVAMLDTGGSSGANSGSLSLDEFEELLNHHEIIIALATLEVDVVAFVDFVRFATPEDDEISLAELTELVLQCRGNQTCTVKDIMELRKFVAMQTKLLREDDLSEVHRKLRGLHATMGQSHKHLREIHTKVHSK